MSNEILHGAFIGFVIAIVFIFGMETQKYICRKNIDAELQQFLDVKVSCDYVIGGD